MAGTKAWIMGKRIPNGFYYSKETTFLRKGVEKKARYETAKKWSAREV